MNQMLFYLLCSPKIRKSICMEHSNTLNVSRSKRELTGAQIYLARVTEFWFPTVFQM